MVREQLSPYLLSREKRNLQRTLGLGFCSWSIFPQPHKLQPYYMESCLPTSTFCQLPAPLVLWYLPSLSFLSCDGHSTPAQDHSSLSPALDLLLELKPRQPWFCHFPIHNAQHFLLPGEATLMSRPLGICPSPVLRFPIITPALPASLYSCCSPLGVTLPSVGDPIL